MKKILLLLLVGSLIAVSAGSYSPPAVAQDDIIVVGSKNFNEAITLSYIVYYALEDAGFRVIDQTDTGSTAEVRQALLEGEIDVYVEYTGTGVLLLSEQYPDIVSADTAFDPVNAISTVTTFDLVFNDLLWLNPAPANNTYVLVVTRSFSEETGVTSMSGLAEYVRDENTVVVAGSDEFFERPDAFPSFLDTYRFDVPDSQRVVLTGAGPSETLAALEAGPDGTNVAMAFGTAGELLAGNFLVLEDDLNAQPIYQPAPIFREAFIRENPDIAAIMQPVFASLDARTLQRLNANVSVFGDTPEQAARAYLDTIDTDAVPVACRAQVVTDGGVNGLLRGGPGFDFEVVTSVASGTEVQVVGRNEATDWYQIQVGEVEDAWVAGILVRYLNCPDQLLPVTE
ncbi:MAG: SH3 domain-containing protein [Chloroflexi bacterium]|nr:SH3 domain-containing protein [Chloroflexota bacterium]